MLNFVPCIMLHNIYEFQKIQKLASSCINGLSVQLFLLPVPYAQYQYWKSILINACRHYELSVCYYKRTDVKRYYNGFRSNAEWWWNCRSTPELGKSVANFLMSLNWSCVILNFKSMQDKYWNPMRLLIVNTKRLLRK